MKKELIYTAEAQRLLGASSRETTQMLLTGGVKRVRRELDPATGRKSSLWRKDAVLELVERRIDRIDADVEPTWKLEKRAGKVVKTCNVAKTSPKAAKIPPKTHGGGHVKGAASVKNKLKRLEAIRDVMSNGDYESHRDLIIEDFLDG